MNRIVTTWLLCSALFSSTTLPAQDYLWDTRPALHNVPEKYARESAVFLLEKRHIRYVRTGEGRKSEIEVYRTIHRIIRLLDDKGVEYFNKMTISSAPGAPIGQIRGRTIKAGGKIINLDQGKIKTNKDESGQLQYHLAFEGVEKGDEVELVYTEKRPFAVFGTEVLQFGLPVAEASFRMEAPAYFRFDSKGYNSFPDAADTLIGDTRYYTATQTNLDAVEEEEYSDVTPNLKRIEYKLNYTGDSKIKRYSWNDLAGHMHERFYTFSDKEEKALRGFLETLDLAVPAPEEEKIRRIEEKIKQDIVYDDKLHSDEAEQLNYILDKKTSGETGLVRLFVACFEAAGIRHELGITSNRFEYPVDEKFENWNRPDNYIFYFPARKQYLTPATITLRYPMIPAALRENKAIFCKRTTIGDITTALASIRTVPAPPMSESANTIKADIRFAPETMTPGIRIVHGFSGYTAMSIREAVTFIPADKEKEMVQSLFPGLADQPEDIVSYSIANKGLEHYSDNKPVEITAELQPDRLMETAGNKWLFKVGEVIGPQAEMYEDKERKLPISMPFPHTLVRDITIHIPEGYRVTNPSAVVLKVQDQEGTMGFVSDYTLEKGIMQIHINEFYSVDAYPAAAIEPFRKVINAAADFNKVILVLEKETK